MESKKGDTGAGDFLIAHSPIFTGWASWADRRSSGR